jgi:hypothetical protein
MDYEQEEDKRNHMNSQLEMAIEAIERHVSTLQVGQKTKQLHVHSEQVVRQYAERYDIPYPGLYISDDGELLVPPGMIFLRPAQTFGITIMETPAQARLGIFTQSHRQYMKPVRVGHKILFEGEIADIFERRGFYYVAAKWEATDEDDDLVGRGMEWHTLGFVRRE